MKPGRWFQVCQKQIGRRALPRFVALALVISAQAVPPVWCQDPEISPPDFDQRAAAKDSRKTVVLQIRTGSYVEVRLESAQKLRGRLGDLGEEDFTLRTIQNDRMTEVRVPYREMQSVRVLAAPQTRGNSFDRTLHRAHLVMGLVATSVLIGILVYATAQR